MVTLGAITTILMLSLSPFAQQAVRVDDMRLARSANVSMSTKLEISPFRAAAGQDEISEYPTALPETETIRSSD